MMRVYEYDLLNPLYQKIAEKTLTRSKIAMYALVYFSFPFYVGRRAEIYKGKNLDRWHGYIF